MVWIIVINNFFHNNHAKHMSISKLSLHVLAEAVQVKLEIKDISIFY